MKSATIFVLGMLLAGLGSGCSPNGLSMPGSTVTDDQLRRRVEQVLFEAVESDSPQSRCNSLEALAHWGSLAVPARIRKGLYDPIPAVRFAAALAAGDLKDYTSKNLLERLLRDDNLSVQLAAGYALEKMGDQRFGQWFDAALFHEDAKVRAQACILLGKLGNTPLRRDSREKLWSVLRKQGQEPAVKLQAAEALASLGDERVLENLLRYANSGYADDRIIAIEGLGKLTGSDAFTMLATLADDVQLEVQLAAIRGLAHRATSMDIVLVRKAMHHSDPDDNAVATARVRGLAALAMGRIGTLKDAGLLYGAMVDENIYVRTAAARATIDFLRRKREKIDQN